MMHEKQATLRNPWVQGRRTTQQIEKKVNIMGLISLGFKAKTLQTANYNKFNELPGEQGEIYK
jgi:hypothetical protein